MFLPSDFLQHEVSFALWSVVVLIGLAVFLFATFRLRGRPARHTIRIAGIGLMILGAIAAAPHTPKALHTLGELLTPEPSAKETVLAQDQTVDGVALKAGSVAGVMPDGRLATADLKSPAQIDGFIVIGHVEFFRVNEEGREATRLYRATLASDQEIPASPGMWCSPKRVFQIDRELSNGSLMECELARSVTRNGITIPAESFIQCQPSYWRVELPAKGDPMSIEGISVPAGWNVMINVEPATTLESFYPGIGSQPWVEVGGVRFTGLVHFDAKSVSGALWQDATIRGALHKAGESVELQR